MKNKDIINSSGIVVAVDIGASGVRAMAARRNIDDTLHILGAERTVKYGGFTDAELANSSEVGMQIKRTVLLLANRIQQPIEKVYICLGSKLLQVKDVFTMRTLARKDILRDKMFNDMHQECWLKIANRHPSISVISAEPTTYIIDGVETDIAPDENQKMSHIEIVFNTFMGQKTYQDKIVGSFNRANLAIGQQWSRPDSLLTALTAEDDWLEGVGIIDFGAQTTTMSLYQNNRFIYNTTIPSGSYDLTCLLMTQLCIDFDLAERLKTEYAFAAPNMSKQVQKMRIPTSFDEGVITIDTNIISQIVNDQLQPVVAELMRRLEKYKHGISKIYLTGGGCQLRGLKRYLSKLTEVEIEYGSHADWLEDDAEETYYEPYYAPLVGTLALAAEYEKEHPQAKEIAKQPIKQTAKDKITKTLLITFGYDKPEEE